MDYTKDAILIHEGLKSYEDDSASLANGEREAGGGRGLHQKTLETFSILTMMNSSDFVGKKMTGNSSSSLVPSTSSFEDQYGDYNDTMEYIPYSMRPETYIVPVLFAIIFIIGVIGNGTLIVIFIKDRSMRNVPNMFIVSLAIGDLLVILFCVPFTSTVYTVDSWPYGVVVCKFSEFVKDLSVGVSVFTLTALSADRYFAIVDPMRKLTGRRATRITIISIVGIWTLSILVALPSALYSYIRVFPEYEEGEEPDPEDDGRTFQVCYPYPKEFGHTYAKAMVMFHFLVYYAIPLFFIATFYIIMARHLVLSTRNMPGEAQGQVKQIQARKKVAKMILSFVVIFAICFFPHRLFLLWFYFYPDSEYSFNAFWNICRIVGFCLSFMNSCINPITLYCVSGTFRKQFNDHLFCCFCTNPDDRPSRGGRYSFGGTLAGMGNRGGGLCAACVSLSGNNGHLHGNDSRYGNGSLGRGGNGRLPRGSTWEYSDRMMSKRRSTWETQTTVVNHRIPNLHGGGTANIHVNLCSEHENIPLRNMVTQGNTGKWTVATAGAQGTNTIVSSADRHETTVDTPFINHHEHHHRQKISSNGDSITRISSPSDKSYLEGKAFHGRSQGRVNNSTFYRNKLYSDKSPEEDEDVYKDEENDAAERSEIIFRSSNKNYKDYPSLIEEETSGGGGGGLSEHESNNKSSSQQLSPNKSYTEKVGEIFSKISSKYSNNCSSSPAKLLSSKNSSGPNVSSNSSPLSKSPTKIAASASPLLLSSIKNDRIHEHSSMVLTKNNFNNNNYTSGGGNMPLSENTNTTEKEIQHDESEIDEYTTLTSFISVPEVETPMRGNLEETGKVIICYN